MGCMSSTAVVAAETGAGAEVQAPARRQQTLLGGGPSILGKGRGAAAAAAAAADESAAGSSAPGEGSGPVRKVKLSLRGVRDVRAGAVPGRADIRVTAEVEGLEESRVRTPIVTGIAAKFGPKAKPTLNLGFFFDLEIEGWRRGMRLVFVVRSGQKDQLMGRAILTAQQIEEGFTGELRIAEVAGANGNAVLKLKVEAEPAPEPEPVEIEIQAEAPAEAEAEATEATEAIPEEPSAVEPPVLSVISAPITVEDVREAPADTPIDEVKEDERAVQEVEASICVSC